MATRPFPIRLSLEGDQEFRSKVQASINVVTGLNRQLDATGQQGARRAADAFAAFGVETDRLRAKFVPLAAAQQQYKASLDEINRALKVGALSEAEHAAAISRTRLAYSQQVNSIRGITPVLAAGANSYRNFGHVAQQAGFQVGDFAVQVASGQGVIRPFIQQGTQLLQFFGPWGSILGAAGAVVGALAIGLIGLGDATEEAAEAQEKHNDLMERAKTLTDELAGSTYNLTVARRAERDLAIEQARAETDKLQADIEARRQLIEDRIRIGIEEGRIRGANLGEAVAVSVAADPEIKRLNERISVLRQYRAELGEFEDQISRGTAGGAGDPSRLAEDRAKLLESLRAEADLIGKVGLARQIDINLSKAQVSADSDLGKTIVDLTTRIYNWNEAQKDASQTDKDRLKRIAENEKAMRDAIEAEAEARKSIDAMVAKYDDERAALALTDRQVFVLTARRKAEQEAIKAGIDVTEAEIKRVERAAAAYYDASEAKKANAKAAQDAARERERIAEQEARALALPFENFAEGVQDSITDAFRTALDGGIESFGDFFDSVLNVAKQFAAEMASLLIFRPILGGVVSGVGVGAASTSALAFGGGGIVPGGGGFGFGGIGDLFGGAQNWLFGAAQNGKILPTSGILGSGGQLFGSTFLAQSFLPVVGSVLPGLIGGNFAQAGLGGIGALAGTAVGGPIGGAIGGLLGNVIGGLFGGKKKSPQAVTDIVIGAGGLAGIGGNTVRAGGNVGATRSLAEGIADAVNEAVAALGGTLSAGARGGYVLNSVGKNTGNQFIAGLGRYGIDSQEIQAGFSSGEEAASAVVAAILKEAGRTGTLTGIGATQRSVLRNSSARDLAGLNADLTFAELYDQLTGTTEETTQAAEAIKALNKQFAEAKTQAAALGLNVGKLTTAQNAAIAKLTTDFNAANEDFILGVTNPLALALREFERFAENLRKEAAALGADEALLEQRLAIQRQQITSGGGSLRSFFDELTFGALSGSSPGASVEGARAAFEAAVAQGNVTGIETYGRAYLESARGFYASGSGYQDALNRVRGVVGDTLSGNSQIVTSLDSGFGNLSALFAVNNNLMAEMVEENRQLREQIRALAK